MSVGDQHDFMPRVNHGFASMHTLPVRNLPDGVGNAYICFAPPLGESCTHTD